MKIKRRLPYDTPTEKREIARTLFVNETEKASLNNIPAMQQAHLFTPIELETKAKEREGQQDRRTRWNPSRSNQRSSQRKKDSEYPKPHRPLCMFDTLRKLHEIISIRRRLQNVQNKLPERDALRCRHIVKKLVMKNWQQVALQSSYKKARRGFDEAEESYLEDYLKKAADIYFGLTPKEVRHLAYNYGKALNKKMPKSWAANLMTRPDWFSGFLKRLPRLSIRTPHATSLSRATSINKTNVNFFFQNLSVIMERHHFLPNDIYNMDETGITTVQRPDRVVARKGYKQIGSLTSAESGTLIIMAIVVSASGNSVPPFFVFPRVHYKEHLVRGGPPGSVGSKNPSGVFGLFKEFVNSACAAWMKTHPGSTITIYDAPGIVATALPQAVSPVSIMAKFRVAGIHPFNSNIFTEADFLSSYVTDRPNPVIKNTVSSKLPIVEINETNLPLNTLAKQQKPKRSSVLTPEDICPFPKAGERKTTRVSRRKRTSAILTDFPVRNEIAASKIAKRKQVKRNICLKIANEYELLLDLEFVDFEKTFDMGNRRRSDQQQNRS
ncbi:hypothetical protein ILUMI_00374 [Ignelater luminosus]|uniref:DDE-1 domain-containing protein n=1 Tax=Ignelater luminosus TaxID=2038154 RepID=A0A8K0GN64_IGNLU|nr:hypothetical protein ILUMI_00374 [Ignelater luminosus]